MTLRSILFALTALNLNAQSIVGDWQGTLQPAQGKGIRVVAKITQTDNRVAATLYNVDQPAQPIITSAVTFQGGTFKMTIPSMGATYAGRLSSDANTLTGTLTQTQPVPVNFARATRDTAWEIPPPPAAPKAMAANVDPTFEVATIKPTANPGREGSNINVSAAGVFVTGNTSLKDLLIFAYGVHPSQLQGLPAWAEDEKYDISAKPDHEGIGNDAQIRSMLQKLIAERFAFRFRREKKELSAYTLNIGRTGQPKLTPNTSGVNLPAFRIGTPGTLGARNATMEQFGGFLQARVVDRPVVDKTGLTGKFDLTLTWRPEDPTPDSEARPDLFAAMQEQLGLRFQAERTPIDILIIDSVSKPSEN